MARSLRISPSNIPHHVIQRGNNRQTCFNNDSDMKAYIHWLKEYACKFEVEIHAWVLMTNHTHILCTPKQPRAISKMMQSLGRVYVRHFNHKHGRSGTLWEGRFKSCLVQTERYLLQLYQYIELNPVRAHMVCSPADYSWSSYQCNALGKISELITPHPTFLALGGSDSDRQANYRALFTHQLSPKLLEAIRCSTNQGGAIGTRQFQQHIEQITGHDVTIRKRGRPTKKE